MQQTRHNRDRPTVAQQSQPEIIAAGGARLRFGKTLGSILARKTKDRLPLNYGRNSHVPLGVGDSVLPSVLGRGEPVLVSVPPGNSFRGHSASPAGFLPGVGDGREVVKVGRLPLDASFQPGSKKSRSSIFASKRMVPARGKR